MSIFDSLISEVKHNIGLDDHKAGALLSALLNYITNTNSGGVLGFIDRFRTAGLSSVVDSWIGNGSNEELLDDQVISVLGNETIDSMAKSADLDSVTTTRALGSMIPGVIDSLSPDGELPDDESLLSKIKGFLADWGGTIGGAVAGGAAATAAVVGNAADKVSDVVADVVGDGVAGATRAADSAKSAVTGGINSVVDSFENNDGNDGGNSWLRWLFLLLILGLLIALGYMFCGRGNHVGNVNTNANHPAANTNVNKTTTPVDSSFKLVAKDGKYTVTGVVPDQKTFDDIKAKLSAEFGAENIDLSGLKIDANAKPFATGWWDNFGKLLPSLKGWKDGSLAFAGNAITEANGLPSAAIDQIKALFTGWTLPDVFGAATATVTRTLSEIHLPSGAKLQAYPGGIEDQVVKFITSDDYKSADNESLKSKWFDFDDLNFKFGTTELDENSKRQLDNIVTILKEFPTVKIKIGGYTDKKGDDAANKTLSANRAKAVQTALKNAGVGEQVPEAEGYGEEFAKIPETASDEERKVDRRTSIRLIK